MANDPFAPADPPEPAAAARDYEAFSEALSASARGRAFLVEHARRSRSAETRTLIASLKRIETMIEAQQPLAAATQGRDIVAIITAIRDARAPIAASPLPERAEKLDQLLDLLERRLQALAEPAALQEGTPDALVPPAEQADLPIPPPVAENSPTPPPDPLAVIKLLSEAERIALFT
jgi:hypothetical protein